MTEFVPLESVQWSLHHLVKRYDFLITAAATTWREDLIYPSAIAVGPFALLALMIIIYTIVKWRKPSVQRMVSKDSFFDLTKPEVSYSWPELNMANYIRTSFRVIPSLSMRSQPIIAPYYSYEPVYTQLTTLPNQQTIWQQSNRKTAQL